MAPTTILQERPAAAVADLPAKRSKSADVDNAIPAPPRSELSKWLITFRLSYSAFSQRA
jgi:hypothetical protein